ncbi:MAG: cell division protein FtsW [Fimbriimonadales bacterium]|nr:MAG: cell division protein FtsW [Fimbriimonadales bacterium]
MRRSHTLRNGYYSIEPPHSALAPAAGGAGRVPAALWWAPLALALVGLFFQGSVVIVELGRLGKDGSMPDVAGAVRPVLMQLLWLLIGVGALWGCSRVKGRFWLASAWLWLLLSWGALLWLALDLPGALTINGATRWIGLPLLNGATLQPAEFYKLATLLWMTAVWSAPRVGRGVWIGVLLWLSGAALIVLQPDKDTATLVLMLGFGVAFLGGLRSQWVLLSMLAGGVFAGALIATPLLLGALRSQPWETQPGAYVVKRIQATLNPWAHEREVGYQMVRAQIAVGSGGLFGVGIGEGREKRSLPAVESDYIFAAIAEEFGLAGSLSVMTLFGILVWACFASARRAPTRAGRLYLAGLGVWIGVGALMNLSMAVGLLPTMGLPLPFVSAGGSALVSLMAAVGIGVALTRESP